MAHRKRKETKLQPSTAGPGNMLGCCLISFHFLRAIHPIRPVHIILFYFRSNIQLDLPVYFFDTYLQTSMTIYLKICTFWGKLTTGGIELFRCQIKWHENWRWWQNTNVKQLIMGGIFPRQRTIWL